MLCNHSIASMVLGVNPLFLGGLHMKQNGMSELTHYVSKTIKKQQPIGYVTNCISTMILPLSYINILVT